MAEIRRGLDGVPTGERLPWLEPVEDEDGDAYLDEPGGHGGLILAAIALLAGLALIVAGVVWFRQHRAANADIGAVIHAEPGPYKVKPTDPGGMHPDDVGEVAADTSQGQEIDSMLDPNAMPEQPIIGRAARAVPQSVPQPEAAPQPRLAPVGAPPLPRAPAPPAQPTAASTPPAPKAPAAPASADIGAAPTGGGPVQLGAFSSEAKAKAAWKSLSSRFAFLHDMDMEVVPVPSGDATLYRLRAGSGDLPGKICARLRIAGESCTVVGR